MVSLGPSGERFTALVLAADRGADDPVAQAGGQPRKCLVPVGGVAMLERVVTALLDSGRVARVGVSIKEAGLPGRIPLIAELQAEGRVCIVQAAASPSRSVLAGFEALDQSLPFLVTTSDHALLSPDMVRHFCDSSLRTGKDVTAGLTAAHLLQTAYPESRRTYLRFRDDGYSGANLFAFLTPQGLEAARLWRKAEEDRKKPWRIAAVFGLGALVRYLLRRDTLDQALAGLSERLPFTAAAVKMPQAEAAIDVDKPEDLELVERILSRAG